jgi:REP element-mobilizing transposase RayT
MVLAYHVIVTAYGFWLPNDQRGSWSDFVRRWELLKFGPATKVETRRSVANRPFDPALRAAAKRALMYRPVIFDGYQALCIANAFADGVRRSGYVILACSILPDHVHLVIRRHSYHVEQVTNRLKGSATRFLTEAGLHPMRDQIAQGAPLPSPWASGLWKVYLDSPEDIRRAIDYVEGNPEKEKKKRQTWKFVVPYGL